MANVLIRDVETQDLEELRAAARDRGVALQVFLREAVHMQAMYLRRQAALRRTAARLADRRPVADADRAAVLDAVDAAHAERTEQLAEPSP